MSKKELYFKFIFPEYNNLTNTDPAKPGTGSVKILCDTHPDNVKTYERLPIRLRKYVDQFLSMPKFFSIRVYWDDPYGDAIMGKQRQGGGVSLLVSHSPEIHSMERHCSTKFRSNYDNKIVYCSIVVSSGDFFYNWCLPEEVLSKSGLRDSIVSSKYHPNWYLTSTEKSNYFRQYSVSIGKPHNPSLHTEKMVFDTTYFFQGEVVQPGKRWYDTNGDGKYDTLGDLAYDPDDPNHNNDNLYLEWQNNCINNHLWSVGDTIGLTYGLRVGSIPTTYFELLEDLKRDFVDLEATRRILHYYNGTQLEYSGNPVDIHPINDIPKIVSGFGKNTVLSYERPQEYIDRPPMTIRYDLLRNTLDDRDPYGDCETVLTMWVADSDPMNVSDGDIAGLKALNWEQYAVPISVRCCLKNSDSSVSYSNKRLAFLLPYTYSTDAASADAQNEYVHRYYTRRDISYDNTKPLKDVMYLQGLMRCSNDYLLSYHNKSFADSVAFNIQKYLVDNYYSRNNSLLKALYVRKQYGLLPLAQQQSNYYIIMNNSEYKVYPNSSQYIVGNNSSVSDFGSQFKPSLHLLQSSYEDFETHDWRPWPNENSWSINNDIFVMVFSIDSSKIRKVKGTLKLVDATTLKNNLLTNAATYNYADHTSCDWSNVYLSSFCISPIWNFSNADALLNGINGDKFVPLGFLDGHVSISNTVYGRSINGSLVIGFQNVYNYSSDDRNHFRYNSVTDTYDLVIDSSLEYTAYVIDYV